MSIPRHPMMQHARSSLLSDTFSFESFSYFIKYLRSTYLVVPDPLVPSSDYTIISHKALTIRQLFLASLLVEVLQSKEDF